MIDSHCHLDLSAFDNDIEQVIQRAQQVGVSRFHIPGTTQKGWSRQQDLAAQFSCIDYSLGLHPYFLDIHWKQRLDVLETLLAQRIESDSSFKALGEIGLDKVCHSDWSIQYEAFQQQVSIAKSLRLPVILHHRKTHSQLLQVIKQSRYEYGGIIHAFSGSYELAMAYLEKGFVLGIGGTISYERAQKTRETLSKLSLNDVVLETDSPDMPLCGLQGQRNEPCHIPSVLQNMADIMQAEKQDIIKTSTNNYFRVLSRR